MEEGKKRELVELLARYEVPLIEDDVYGELYFGNRQPLPVKAFDRKGLVTLAPGYRIGWVAPGRLHTGSFDKHLRKLRHAQEAQLASMNAALARYFPSDIRVSRPSGGYFLWVEFPQGFDTLALHGQAAQIGISIAPGPIFSPSRQFCHCIRLNYGSPWNDAHEQGMELLGGLAKSLLGLV